MQSNVVDARVIRSSSIDPWYNLALEEYLLNQVGPNQIILYLWQNNNTVVIGRNQNPWKECRCKKLEEEGGKLARRLSGGGAVYHDLGNLNFTFIMDKNLYDVEKQLKVILIAMDELGINAQFSGRNDLTVGDKKFSGNAFYFTDTSAYHHGTLLINTDFNKLIYYLQVSKAKIKSKGIDSIRSRVVNLSDLNKDITIEKTITQLHKSFIATYSNSNKELAIDPEIDFNNFKNLYNKYASWEWQYGQSPNFDIVFENRFKWGGLELGLNLENGHITSAKIFSDAMNSILIQDLASLLKGLPFKMTTIVDKVNQLPRNAEDEAIINDIQKWLLLKG